MVRSALWPALAIAAILAAMSAPAGAAEWRLVTVKPDGFSIDFSGDIAIEATVLDEKTLQALVRSTMYMQDGGNTAYVAAATLSKGVLNFQSGVDQTMATYKCGHTDSDDSKTLADGTINRVIYANHCLDGNATVAGSFFVRGQWFYQVIYLIPDGADTADAEHFLHSFKLLPP